MSGVKLNLKKYYLHDKLPNESIISLLRNAKMLKIITMIIVKSATILTRDDVVSQRLKFGSAFLSSSWESKIALFF